ncbi:MAG: hypothetical protein ACF8SC_06460 [Phycisphaerales bacterium JB037]
MIQSASDAARPSPHPARWWLLGPGLALAAAIISGVVWMITGGHVWAEDGLIEYAQLGLWGVCVLVAGAVALTTPGRARAAAAWRGVLGAVAGARELDLHIKLNPETLGEWGVRYRLDWWTDMSVPLGVKSMWLAIGLAIGIALVLPIYLARQDPIRLLKARHPASVLFAIAIGGLAMGWAMDDLFRGWFAEEPAQALEELCELAGVGFYLGSVIACRRIPPEGIAP